MHNVGFSHVSAGALVPEQLVHYVRAVTGRAPVLCGNHIAYIHERHAVLVAYPGMGATSCEDGGTLCWDWTACAPEKERRPANAVPSLAAALKILRRRCSEVTVLAPFRPAEAPRNATASHDCYWQTGLPPRESGGKLRNTLHRAARDVQVTEDAWSSEHDALVRRYLDARPLRAGSRSIYASLPSYAALAGDATQGPKVCLLSARSGDGRLAGFTLGDLSGLHTAFYMFAFRHDNAPPGTADLLLSHLMDRAAGLGLERMNLGLGINNGISFFKKKWGAAPLAPCVETSWSLDNRPRGSGLLALLLRRFSGQVTRNG